MATIEENLTRLLLDKESLRLAIINLGVTVEEDLTVDLYKNKVDSIELKKEEVLLLLDGSITSIELPKGITKIGNYAFYGLTNITSIAIPNTVTSIDDSAFYNCSGLASLSCLATVPPTLSSSALTGTALTEIVVPASSYALYKSATNWKTKSSIIKIDLENITYKSLSITAEDVIGNSTTTTITYTFIVDGDSILTGEHVTDATYSDMCTSDTFDLNTSTTETVQRTITLTMNGLTASTTITLGTFLPPIQLSVGENNIDNSYIGNTQKTWSNRTGRLYSFTAPETATYKFLFNDNITGGSALDTYGYLLNEAADTQLTYNDDSGGNSDPMFTYACTAGTTYLILIAPYSTSSTKNVIGTLTISKS